MFLVNKLLNELAEVDGLTGLSNRRSLNIYLDRIWRQAMRDQQDVAIAMIDVGRVAAGSGCGPVPGKGARSQPGRGRGASARLAGQPLWPTAAPMRCKAKPHSMRSCSSRKFWVQRLLFRPL